MAENVKDLDQGPPFPLYQVSVDRIVGQETMLRALLLESAKRLSILPTRLCALSRRLSTRTITISARSSLNEHRDRLFFPARNLSSSAVPSVGTEKMIIGFTCKVCNQRTHRNMSRLAYTQGVVLIECPGCRNRHLIADHLGWFDMAQGEGWTVEKVLTQRGEQVRRSWRTDLDGAGILEVLGSKEGHQLERSEG